jgi:hypothetical protein
MLTSTIQWILALILLLGKNVAHTSNGEDAFGGFEILFDGGPDAAHVHINGSVKGLELSTPDG